MASGSVIALPLSLNRGVAISLGIVVGLLILIAGGVYGESVTSPEAVAKAYLNDVGRNDAIAAWNDIEVSSSSGSSQKLTAKLDWMAMMALSENHHAGRSAVAATRADTSGSRSTVTVSWKEGSQTQTGSLVLDRTAGNRYFLFPDWRIVIVPSTLSFALPSADTKVTVDGSPVAAIGSTVTAAVFPGTHKIVTSASSLFDADTQTAIASGVSTPITLNLTSTAVGSVAIKKAIGDLFAKCAAATVASPVGCPQSSSESGTGFTWALVGDPAASVALSVDSSSKVHAIGHYLMLDTFGGTFPNGVRHRIESGAYEAVMDWSGSSMNIASVSPVPKAPPLNPPASVMEVDVKAAVASAFQACTAVPVDGSPDCPQSDYAFAASDFRWTIKGDPLVGSTVSFDADHGFWKVVGTYTFHDSYDTSSAGHQEHDLTGTYVAYAIYDGAKVVTIYVSHV